MSVGASSVAPVIVPEAILVASPSFAFNLNHSGDAGVGETGPLGEVAFVTPDSPATVPVFGEIGVPDGVEDAPYDDDDDDGVEPATIADDHDDDTPRPTPAVGGGTSSLGNNQFPSHFSALELDAMAPQGDPGVPVGFGARETQNTRVVSEFQVGQHFQDKEEVVLSVKTYNICRGVEYKVLKFDNRKYYGKCKEFGSGCTWLIRVSLRQRRSIWEVKRYNGPHTCLATSIFSDHKKLDYHVISAFILPMIRVDAAVSIKVPQNATEEHFGFIPTYRRVWMAKQKAMAQIYGDWEESYNYLPRWVLGVQITMPGSVAVLKTSLVRLFWTFPPCIEAFRHCKSLVGVDGTHLYGKYDGTLLVAIAQDDNSNIISIAFALVEGKNAESWSLFLSHMRQHVTPQPGILVISDRHNGIKAALEAPNGGWLPPTAYRDFCIQHVAANFALSFKGKDARRWLVNAAYVKTEIKFHYWFDILRPEDPTMCDCANRIDYAHWTQHWDEGRRFGHMTTNIFECVNSILKGVRNLPVCVLVKATYGRLAELFVRKGKEAEAQLGTRQQFSQHLIKAIKANLKVSRCFTVILYDRDNSEFTVTETTPTESFSLGTYRVSLTDQTCDCGYFQTLQYPCRPALACCVYARLT
ncbi:uncharacterized protein [Arachis hypogaea]|uniref:uncharacterized protein n=1 Tax=Arachis hypogaea TaxID=3818 RepID=UPI000DECFEF3|nr:uncharacterized protein LOC112722279 [Arachis hypogaea]